MTFLVFEGPDFSGKSTQIKLLQDHFLSLGQSVAVTCEPGGTAFAQSIRELLNPKKWQTDERPNAICELLLFLASRAQNMDFVLSKQKSHRWVICDRLMDSTYVYQGKLKGIPKEYIDAVSAPIFKDILPDMIFVLGLSEKEAKARSELRENNTELDKSYIQKIDRLMSFYKEIIDHKWSYPNGKIPIRYLIEASDDALSTHKKIIEILNTHSFSKK